MRLFLPALLGALILLPGFPASAQTLVRKSVCASGCDYANNFAGLNRALADAASLQATSCVPYVIEIDPANPVDLQGNTLILPPKRCGQYVRVRSQLMNMIPPDGVRINPSSQSGALARIQSTMGKPGGFFATIATAAKTRYWAFEGIEFYGNSYNDGSNAYNGFIFYGETASMFPASADRGMRPDHLEIKHCWFHGVPGSRNVSNGVVIGGNSIRVADSVIEDIATDGAEAHAMLMSFTDGPIDIINDAIDSSTENTLVGGAYAPAGMLPSFLRFAGNKYSKKGYYKFQYGTTDPAWPCRQSNVYRNTTSNHDWICSATSTWVDQGGLTIYGGDMVKNIFEIKMGRGVRVFGNDFSGNWWPDAQTGEVIVLNLTTQSTSSNPAWVQPNTLEAQPWTTITDVQIDANHMHDAMAFMTLGYASGVGPCVYKQFPRPWCYEYPHNDIRVHDNVASNMDDGRDYDHGAQYGGWFAGVNAGDFNIDIRHNTFLLSKTPLANSTAVSGELRSLIPTAGVQTMTGTINIRDNIVPMSLHGITADGLGWGGICTFINALGPGSVYSLSGNILTTDLAEWAGNTYPINTSPAVPSPCNVYNLWPPGTISAASGSTVTDAKFRAVSGYKNTAVDGRDAGADVDRMSWATAGAVDGSLNTALEYKLRSAVPTSSGPARAATIYFTAPSINACTWELSTDANAYSNSVNVATQTRNGRDGIAQWSGLAPGKAYFARATCDGMKLETGVDGRRFFFVTAP